MPELPEVETLRTGLQKYLDGHTITSVEVRLKRIFSGEPDNIVGAKIVAVKRFGKGLVIELNNGFSIAIHIKLTGQLIYRDAKTEQVKVSQEKVGTVPNKFTHVIFHLDHSAVLYYNDLRQFGWIKIVPTDTVHDLPFFKDLGPEPPVVSSQALLTEEVFQKILMSSKTAVKPLLMDQKKIGGIGNIYANDSLFLAKINPSRPAHSLSGQEIKTLYEAILHVLKKGLEEGGASELTFVNALGQEGNYQKHFLAYGQDGKPCSRCKTTMKKVMLGGRGTYYCPHCQQ